MAPTTSSTCFLVISDTHDFEFKNATGVFSLPMPKVDVVLHCGDMTNVGGSSVFKNVLKMLGAIDAEKKLVIAGNHDLDLVSTQ
jgi:predicted phosphodiesterase